MEGLRGDYGSIAALCNVYGITQTDFYRWRDILMDDGSRLFERGGVDRERQRLEDENHKLREVVGSLTMELKKTIGDGCTQTPCPQGKRRQHPAA